MARREGSAPAGPQPPTAPAAPPPEAAPAAAPAPAKSGRASRAARGPAQAAARVPEFAAPASPEQPVVTRWDDYSADEGGMPESADAPTQAKPDTQESVSVDVDGNPVRAGRKAKDDNDGFARPGETATTEEPAAEPETPATPPKPKASERRRAALDALASETRLRGMETQLATERQQREQAQRLLKEGTLGDILRARGIDRDAALEMLATGTEAATPETPAAPVPPELKALQDQVRELRQENQAREMTAGMQAVANEALTVEAAPLVHAEIRSRAVVDYDAKTGKPLTAVDLIATDAIARWRKAGALKGEESKYIREATEDLEEVLDEQYEMRAQALAKKRGAKAQPAAAAPVTPAKPMSNGVTRSVAARPDAKPRALPMDREVRDAEIKRRYGWS